MPKNFVRAGMLAAAAAVLTVFSAIGAQAHVRLFPDSTVSGGFTKLTFRVPNESETAGTTRLAVTLPVDTPLAFVSARPTYGWTVAIIKAKLPMPIDVEGTKLTEAPRTVTWTAQKGQAIRAGEFQEFALSVGPLPSGVKQLSFPAAQTYSDGTVVNWDQPVGGSSEPAHPVPSFALTAAPAAGSAAGAGTAAGTATTAASDGDDSSGAGLATGLAVGGLAVGLLGLGLATLAWRRTALLIRPA